MALQPATGALVPSIIYLIFRPKLLTFLYTFWYRVTKSNPKTTSSPKPWTICNQPYSLQARRKILRYSHWLSHTCSN